MEKRIEVTVTIADKQVTLAGPESFVRAEVQRLTNTVAASSPAPGQSFMPVTGVPVSESIPASEREFMAIKQPSGHSEIVAVLAYFLTKNGQPQFTADDIRRAYARAGVRPPKVVAQALRDAKNAHDYLETGKEKGTFALSLHGQRTVEFDLPKKKSN